MHKLFALLLAIMTIFSLASCSSNTREENTVLGVAVGAVTGGIAGGVIGSGTGAIAAGAISGALIGGVIGNMMDSNDNAHMCAALDNNEPKKITTWKNERTGAIYSISPTSKVYRYKNYQYCRKYRSVGTVGTKKRHVSGVACKMQDGTWQAVDK